MGWKEEEDAVDAREGVCSMTDMLEGGNYEGVRLPGPKPLATRATELSAPATATGWGRAL
jgi:hypothetical protein